MNVCLHIFLAGGAQAPDRELLLRMLSALPAELAPPPDRLLLLERSQPGDEAEGAGQVQWRSYIVEAEELLTGEDLADRSVSYSALSRLQIALVFTEEGAERFARLTRENAGRKLAIVVESTVVSVPIIEGEVRSREAVIHLGGMGSRGQQERAARALVAVLKLGGLQTSLREATAASGPSP